MIECTDKKIWYIKRKKKKNNKLFRLCILIIVFSFLITYYNNFVVQVVYEYCTDKCNTVATECVNSTILKLSNIETNYNNLVSIEKNNNGDITYIETNSTKINKLSSKIALSTAKELQNSLDKGIEIPFLVFSGISLFSGYGRKINYRALEVNKTSCEIVSNFKSTGINQTLHSIYLRVESKINFYMPLNKKEIINTTNVLLCETVLIGKIPEVYLNKGN